MDIRLSRECNLLNLERLAIYFDTKCEVLKSYYYELLNDCDFLQVLNSQMDYCRNALNFRKGVIGKGDVNTVDWFAFQRILLYILIRLRAPKLVLETGVYYGGNSIFILHALRKNGNGNLISIDLPASQIQCPRHPLVGESETYESTIEPGFLVPQDWSENWQLIMGDSLDVIPTLAGPFDLYLHDSEHSHNFLLTEMTKAASLMSENSLMLVDDIDWSNGFFEFCVSNKKIPLLMTDNGKNGLLVRNGLIWNANPRNLDSAFVGK